MAQNVVVGLFEVESEAYQALTQLKQNPGSDERSFLTAAALVKKENGVMRTLDSFDTGENTTDDMLIGGLVGALVGVLGGPIGVLLGSSYGLLIGTALDADDALMGISMLEQTSIKMQDGEIAIIGLAFEEDESILDQKLDGFKVMIVRFDAEAVAGEVEEAQKMAEEMARQARKELREEKKQKRSAEWAGFKAKFKEKDNA